MKYNLVRDTNYKTWLADIKTRIRGAQLKAVVTVNSQLLEFYWGLGADIVAKQTNSNWGDGFLLQLSKDLMVEFPGMNGFSHRNLKYIKQWYSFYSPKAIITPQPVGELMPQPVAQLIKIPWGHNIAIISKCKAVKEALYYVQATIAHNWSRSVLVHQIESGLYKREGKALSNFAVTLPKPQSDLAVQTLKDPYIFDFRYCHPCDLLAGIQLIFMAPGYKSRGCGNVRAKGNRSLWYYKSENVGHAVS